jgi:RNA polymerase sigma-70 factor (ECF subfamily)
VERLLKAVPASRPRSVRPFFALVNQHMRWELNDLARRLDEQPAEVELDEGLVPAPPASGSVLTPTAGGCSRPSTACRRRSARPSAWCGSRR